MKNPWIVLLGLVVATQGLTAWAEGGSDSGSRGGGEVMFDPPFDPKARLRDLVDHTVCRWIKADRLVGQVPQFKSVLDSLIPTHWYLASAISREASNLKICKTAQLRPVESWEERYFAISYSPWNPRQQLGVRIGDTIFLDEGLFNALPPLDQAMTLIHEISHSFIPWHVDQRAAKLRSFIKGIALNAESQMTPEEFSLYITENSVKIVPTTAELNSLFPWVRALLSPTEPSMERWRAFHSLGWDRIQRLFWEGDRAAVWTFVDEAMTEARHAINQGNQTLLSEKIKQGMSPVFEYSSGENLLQIAYNAQVAQDAKATTLVRYLFEVARNQSESGYFAGGRQFGSVRTVATALVWDWFVYRGALYHAQGSGVSEFEFLQSLGGIIDTVQFYPQGSGRLMTLVEALIRAGRDDLARLISGAVDRASLTRAAFALLDPQSTAPRGLIQEWIKSGAISVQSCGSAGEREEQTLLAAALAVGDAQLIQVIAATPGFDLGFTCSGAAMNHDGAVAMLHVFVAQKNILLLEKVLSEYPMNWFELYRGAEEARLGRFEEGEKAIRIKMNR